MSPLRAAVVLAVAAFCGLPASANAEPDLYGLTTTNSLVRFNASDPSAATPVAPISGLKDGESALSIAWKDNEGVLGLTALGSSSRLYTINPATGAAASVGEPFTPRLEGTEFGLIFNYSYSAETLSNTGQHLEVDYDPAEPDSMTGYPGASHESVRWHTTFAYPGPDPPAGTTPDIETMAYLNGPRINGAVQDKYFGIDVARGALVEWYGGIDTVGSLGIPLGRPTALAISPDGYAVLATAAPGSTSSSLYSVDLNTGQSTFLGTVPDGIMLRGLAFVPPPKIRDYGTFNDWLDTSDPHPSHLFERLGDPRPAVSVHYSTTCGDCSNIGGLVEPMEGRLSFASGQILSPLSFNLHDTDFQFRPDQGTVPSFTLKLDDPAGGAELMLDGLVNFYVIDTGPELELPPVVRSTDETADVTIKRASSRRAATVAYGTHRGTAVPWRDYVPKHGVLHFAAGQSTKTVVVRLRPGLGDRKRRTLMITTSSPRPGASEPARDKATLAILADSRLKASLRPGALRDRLLPVSVRCSSRCHGQLALTVKSRAMNHRVIAARGPVHARGHQWTSLNLMLPRDVAATLSHQDAPKLVLSVKDRTGWRATATRRLE